MVILEGQFDKGAQFKYGDAVRDLGQNLHFLAFAREDSEARLAIVRAVGVEARDKRTRPFEGIFAWFREEAEPSARFKGSIPMLERLPDRLGSIEFDWALLAMADDRLVEVWVKTHEGDRRRILSGTLVDGEFLGLPANFVMHEAALAAAIVGQY